MTAIENAWESSETLTVAWNRAEEVLRNVLSRRGGLSSRSVSEMDRKANKQRRMVIAVLESQANIEITADADATLY